MTPSERLLGDGFLVTSNPGVVAQAALDEPPRKPLDNCRSHL
jgi:hypothetical protein